jgi:bifunctional oligoribonuclease and PAP phosphatase NrnA
MIFPVREGMDEAVQAVWDAQEIVLACHVNPDGDAIGSMVGLALGLKALGKTVTVLSQDGVPDTLRFLPGTDRVQPTTDRRDFDLGIGLDAGDLSRLGTSQAPITSAKVVMDIDHHVTGGQFGDVRLLDAESASTAELVYDFLHALGIEPDAAIAQNLLCGVLTDTGGFRFPNTRPRTMEVGGALIAAGASPTDIYEAVYENQTWAAQKLLGRAMERMEKTPDGKIVWTAVLREDFEALGATDKETDGISTARGSEIALLLRELPDGHLRVSLRAREPHDVAKVAAQFGGGGHRLASGCTLSGPPEEAIQRLLATLSE